MTTEYTFEPIENAVNIIYNTTITISEEPLEYLDANVIERVMPQRSEYYLKSCKNQIARYSYAVTRIATSVYLSHLLNSARITQFPYDIYFVRVGYSALTSDKGRVVYTYTNVTKMTEHCNSLDDIRSMVQILF